MKAPNALEYLNGMVKRGNGKDLVEDNYTENVKLYVMQLEKQLELRGQTVDSMNVVLKCIGDIAGVAVGDVPGLIYWAEEKAKG